jgi:hypothetical protein
MSTATIVLAIVVALAAATRSTWSPCGISMLSSITPIGERARGNRWRWTAGWFVIGAVIGGAVLGAGVAALASAVGRFGPSPTAVAAGTVGAAAMAAVIDAGWTPIELPILRRQVDERWLDRYRGWAYGAGFGAQIGVGLATYLMTAAVALMIVLGALSGDPLVGFTCGVVFGAWRGSAVLLGRRLTTAERVRRFHRRFDAAAAPVRRTVIGVELVVAVVAAGLGWGAPVALAGAGLVALGLGLRQVRLAWRSAGLRSLP